MARRPRTELTLAEFRRPPSGPTFELEGGTSAMPYSGQPAWQSNGGPGRGHPARSLPFTLEIPFSEGTLARVHLIGVFAKFASREHEAVGTLGASLQLADDRETLFRLDLLNGTHYGDPRTPVSIDRSNGDGSSITTVGHVEIDGVTHRVDHLLVDVDVESRPSVLRLKDLGSPASFVLFDVLFECEEPAGCPFHSGGGGVSLGEIGAIIRVGDRVRFTRAIDQMVRSIETSDDLDEARGQALTFLAVVTAAMLEMGGSRQMHRIQLDAAREFDHIHTSQAVAAATRRYVDSVTGGLFKDVASPSFHLVDRALAIVERHYARNLTDSQVASQLGLSTSHFRFLFKESTGQPFHKYLVALRLEKARQLLLADEVSVSAVAKAVGFAGLSHFSRAFTQRFSVSPTNVRRQGS